MFLLFSAKEEPYFMSRNYVMIPLQILSYEFVAHYCIFYDFNKYSTKNI